MKNSTFDLVVIGGGATGAGVTLDAASRGLNVALVERDDFASGTSSRSTKLLHGGIRYLETAFTKGDFSQLSLVWEALNERTHMMKIAPFMSHPLPILVPIYKYWQIPYFWAGTKAYDLVAKIATFFDTGLPESYYISRSNALFMFPLLNPENLKGSLVYYDGSHNDSRMNLHLALTASIDGYLDDNFKGAAVANHCEVQSLIKDSGGNIKGVNVKDAVDGDSFQIFGKVVVNCTGPFADTIRKMDDNHCTPYIQVSSGTHLVLPRWYSPPTCGLIIPKTTDGRVIFYLPWEGNTLVGTTDAASSLSALPQAPSDDTNWLVEESSKYINVPQTIIRQDVKSAWAGLRPLVKFPSKTVVAGAQQNSNETASLVRSHAVVVEDSGLISVLGGKWTTYRQMAQDAVDKVAEKCSDLKMCRCRTRNMKIMGSTDTEGVYTTDDCKYFGGTFARNLSNEYKIPLEVAHYLTSNYGFQAQAVLKAGEKESTNYPIVSGHPWLMSEIAHSVRHEMARTITDVIGRRIRMCFIDVNASKLAIKSVGDVLAKELQWDEKTKTLMREEAEAYIASMDPV
eukprot:Filipodium_phascolosomae@DN6019_c0_g1_i1.p1